MKEEVIISNTKSKGIIKCDFGCGKKAIHQFKNGTWCCEKRLQSCPIIRKKNSETNKIKQRGSNNGMFGKKHSKESIEKNSISNKKVWNDPDSIFNSHEWRQKIREQSTGRKIPNNIILKRIKNKYKFFIKIEDIRTCPKTKKVQVRCKNHKCKNSKEKGGWFYPTKTQIYERIRRLEKPDGNDGCYFYCSDDCKQECPLFNLHTDPNREIENNYTQEEYNIWRQEVLKRSNYKCEYCGNDANTVHHSKPQKIELFFSLDPDYGISCCEKCHYKYGHKTGSECSTGNLASKICL